jgi:hypothetical protein
MEAEVYTDASKLDGRIGIDIFCGHPNLQMNLARKIEEEISINSAELFAFFKATEHICASSTDPNGFQIIMLYTGRGD